MSQLRRLRPGVACWHHRLGFKLSVFLLSHLLKASTYHILKLPTVYGSYDRENRLSEHLVHRVSQVEPE